MEGFIWFVPETLHWREVDSPFAAFELLGAYITQGSLKHFFPLFLVGLVLVF
jgi:hypothetical protein